MSNSYYYFMASLPMLQFGAKPPMDCGKFLEDCERLLSENDFQEVLRAVRGQDGVIDASTELLRRCRQFSRNLGNEIAWLRAGKAHKNPADFLRGQREFDPAAVDILNQIIKIENPLEAEIALDHAKWRVYDELVQGHFFDLESVIVYGLKLKILERYREIRSPRGEEIFKGYKEQALNIF